MNCPRRHMGGEEDRWELDDTCSYCGSLNPDTLMKRLETGDVELVPTDKNYKVYVRNIGGEEFKMRFRKECTCEFKRGMSRAEIDAHVTACPHWVLEDRNETKFYFPHLSDAQTARFIELYNLKKMKVGYPGYFYTKPYFAKRENP